MGENREITQGSNYTKGIQVLWNVAENLFRESNFLILGI